MGLSIKTNVWDISPALDKKSTDEKNTTDLKSFYYLEDGTIQTSILDTIEASKKLKSAIYNLGIKYVNNQATIDISILEDIEVYDSPIEYYFKEKVETVYKKFFDKNIKEKVNSLGYKHKLGILLYGKAGSGKTSVFKEYYLKAQKEENAIVFIVTEKDIKFLFTFIQKIRKIQNNPILVFIDEFDDGFSYSDYETAIKIIMDGNMSIDNCLFMAATNYIEKIPKTLTERPSRFKYCIEVEGVQDEKIIEKFLRENFEKVGIDIDYEKVVPSMRGFTVDELKEFIIDKIMDIDTKKQPKKTVGFNK